MLEKFSRCETTGQTVARIVKPETGNCTTRSRPSELSLKSDLIGFDTFCSVLCFRSHCQAGTRFPSYGASSEKEILCHNPLWTCFCNTFLEGTLQKRALQIPFGYLMGNRGKVSLFEQASEVRKQILFRSSLNCFLLSHMCKMTPCCGTR